MAGLDDFAYVKDIPGVAEFVLVRQDGHIVVHDSQDSDRLGQMVMLCGINCDAIKTGIPNRFNYFLFSRDCGEHLMVFPVGGYYLGVIQKSSVASSHVATSVTEFIRNLLRSS